MTAGVLIQRRGVTVTVSIDPARLGKLGPDGRYEIELQGYEIVYADRACHEAFAALMFERGMPPAVQDGRVSCHPRPTEPK